MNRIFRSIWNESTCTFIAASENAGGNGNKSAGDAAPLTGAVAGNACFGLKAIAFSLMFAFGSNALALPTGGAVSAGSASIAGGAGTTTINQSSQNVAINWQGFSIGKTEAVRFAQPNSSAVALNRVLGQDPSSILGSLSANGKVFLVNPNGILFGQGAQVNVGALVASTRNITDSDFMAGNYKFSGTGPGTIVNQGTINADGGYVALLGAKVSNEGVISARLGTIALAAGNAMTLDVAGDGLLNLKVNESAMDALVHNSGQIRADGGQILLTTQAAGDLLQGVVNNTGLIQAQTVENRNGTILLLGNMKSGTVNVGGTLDASAPNGGNGGFIETSAARVNIADDVKITTAAPMGTTGTWLIDPVDFNINAPGGGGDITNLALTLLLVNSNVTISTVVTGTNTATTFFAAPGKGDINVNAPIGIGSGAVWTAAAAPTTLTLNSAGDLNIRSPITATKGNLVVCCGRDVNVNAALTFTNGSVSLAAGNNINVNAAITTVNGNLAMCAGNNVNVNAQITMTDSGSIPDQGLGLPLGLFLSAGNNATGPGVAGGTVIFAPGVLATLTRPSAPAMDIYINYNPVSYTQPTDYSLKFTRPVSLVNLFQRMLVFPGVVDKIADGTTTATLSGFSTTATSGTPNGVTLVAGLGNTANFDTVDVGTGKIVTFSGYSLGGANVANFALPSTCCGPIVQRTTGTITAVPIPAPATTVVAAPVVVALVPVAEGVVVPIVAAPGIVAPGVIAPVVVAPVVVAPVAELPLEVAALAFGGAVMIPEDTLALGPQALNLRVEGIRMPPIEVVAAPPPAFVPPVPPPPVVVPPVVVPPPIFVPPRIDRN